MTEEKRKFTRSKCFLPAELLKSEGRHGLIERVAVRDFSLEGLKLVVDFNLNPGFILESRLYIPEKKLSASFSGEIMWNKFVDSKLEAGLKIRQMNEELKGEIIDWVFPKWMERERGEKGSKIF